ncbi:uncharacterized protein LOC132706936 [Cylas formicarius]|uniref:uncharacterized protein LOC132706936 n=1 Tax=Cylas formicarius TaxID=197179 RepID=UPI0029586973|nr:uncharacterized protein LOC132706936 [Cylas formicarius]
MRKLMLQMNNIHSVVTKIGDIHITNIYKPPKMLWPPQVTDLRPHPAVYLGDFNSHHQEWKYSKNDENGDTLVVWAERNQLFHVFDAKAKGTYRSAAWKQEYNPDLCFVTRDQYHKPVPTRRKVLDNFPHSQHRPIIYEIGIQVPLITSVPRPRWNFGRANWTSFAIELDKCLPWIPPTHKNYDRFIGAVISSAKKHVPRGYRKEYVPGWNENSDRLYQQFLDSGDGEIADELLHSLDKARRDKWTSTVESLDFKKSSRKAWSLLRKLGDDGPTSRGKSIKQFTTNIKKQLKHLKLTSPEESTFSCPFTIEEVNTAIKDTKSGKAPGLDGVHPEFLIHCGKSWRLKPNPNKTEVCCFHLNTKMAHRQLQVYADNHLLTHNTTPKYLGVALDRTLSFKQHLQNTAAK